MPRSKSIAKMKSLMLIADQAQGGKSVAICRPFIYLFVLQESSFKHKLSPLKSFGEFGVINLEHHQLQIYSIRKQ